MPGHAGTRDSGDPSDGRAFFQADNDGTDDHLGATDFCDRRLRNGRIDDHRCELHRILGCGQNQLALPRHRSPGGQVVRLQAMSLCDLIHHSARAASSQKRSVP
ncbi:hypothetical protein AJ87_35950 [Rhizobium yanglingense]|nr:hypothetical protein AJ87_35950 [Rhizobium yanglingense]